MTEAGAATPWREVLTGRAGRITAGLVLTEVAVAVQVLLLAAAMPAVARDLHGLDLYGWTLSAAAVGVVVATPLAGHAVSRWSPRLLLQLAAFVAVAGLMLSALAPTMSVVVLGRFLLGCGVAAQYAVSLTSAIRELPSGAQARVFAITGLAWVVPGIIGPPTGALLASTVGWRWALIAPIPLVVASAALLVPLMQGAPSGQRDGGAPVAATAITAAGIVALLSILSAPHGPLLLLAVPAAAVILVGMARLMPPGTLRAAPGLPAVIAVQVTLNFAYFAGDGFLPLALTSLLGRTLTQAGISITLSALAWSAAGLWQSRVTGWASPRLLVASGAGLILAGALGVVLAIVSGSFIAAYVAWTVAGVGMGVAYQTSWLMGSSLAEQGREGMAVSRLLLAETLGASLGSGMAGGAVALGGAASLRTGLIAAFLIVAMGAATATMVGMQQSSRPPGRG